MSFGPADGGGSDADPWAEMRPTTAATTGHEGEGQAPPGGNKPEM